MKEEGNVWEWGDFDDGRCITKSEPIETEKQRKKSTQLRRKGGRDCLPFSKVGDVYLYVDDAEIRQVCYEIFVSKKSWKRRECASPATIPHGDVIQKKDRNSI